MIRPTRMVDLLADRIARLGRAGVFLSTALWQGLTPPWRLYPVVRQIHFIGARSLPVIVVAGTFVGMVVALQFHDTLLRFGAVGLLGAAVGLSLVRELGPVITALVIIGRAGSALCAEISIMRNEHQIDALDCMAVDPYRFLIAPRLLAAIISVPLLTAIFIGVGIGGGYFVGVVLFGLSPGAYLGGMFDSVLWRDLVMGTVKGSVFGLLMAWICLAKGFFLHLDPAGAHGSEGVSRVTTDAVVLASISVLFSDYLISALIL
ncbi:MAG: ABC transporter permease [Gammaproteobacteria bacterium]|nr:ABC transporter permease [Gammaproteobacteria bacterium]